MSHNYMVYTHLHILLLTAHWFNSANPFRKTAKQVSRGMKWNKSQAQGHFLTLWMSSCVGLCEHTGVNLFIFLSHQHCLTFLHKVWLTYKEWMEKQKGNNRGVGGVKYSRTIFKPLIWILYSGYFFFFLEKKYNKKHSAWTISQV